MDYGGLSKAEKLKAWEDRFEQGPEWVQQALLEQAKERSTPRSVIIEVHGGVVHVAKQDRGTRLVVHDFDVDAADEDHCCITPDGDVYQETIYRED